VFGRQVLYHSSCRHQILPSPYMEGFLEKVTSKKLIWRSMGEKQGCSM
jgi:hypothetical protein